VRSKFEFPEIIDFDLQKARDKPWRDSADQSCFFNHGFNEEIFVEYQIRLKNMRYDMERYSRKKAEEHFQQKHIQHKVLDFYTPLEYGGFGKAVDAKRTEHCNFLPKDCDIPEVKYRTVGNNKNEFFVSIPEKTGKECDYSHVKRQHRIDEREQKDFDRRQQRRTREDKDRRRRSEEREKRPT